MDTGRCRCRPEGTQRRLLPVSHPLSREFQAPSAGGLVRAGFAGVGPGLRTFLKGWCLGDFPGSPVVKILLFHCRKQRFDLWLGK